MRRIRGRRHLEACGLALGALALACTAKQPEARAPIDTCPPASGQLAASAVADGMAGDYRLHLVATTGPDSGAAVNGRLALSEPPDTLRQPAPVLGIQDTTTRYPLSGTVELDWVALGAVNTGALGSTDRRAPGVLLIERHTGRPGAPVQIMLRLGAEANRRGLVRYDGGYFALTVRSLHASGFAGTWASGALGPAAAGHFCAERTGP
ncbi:MAG: hypothetical protein M3Q93_02575 [Gemmatimonadota bacterium]|nr:hypothetical protein [Gemmatimonadota bacterium]